MFSPLLIFGTMALASALSAEPVTIEVVAEKWERRQVPASFALPEALANAKGLALVELDSGRAVSCQVEHGHPPRVFWMIDHLAAGATRRYKLSEALVSAKNTVTTQQTDRDLLLSVGQHPVLRYSTAVMPSDDPSKPFYRRSGFIHPVFDPRGRALTEAMPPDHMHQHGIMFAWVNSEFEGRKVDFWNSFKQEGEVRHTKLVSTTDGPVFAQFTTQLEHVDLTAPGGPKVALKESWDVRVFHRTDGFLIDWKSTMTCAGASPLKLNKNDYGGLCVRGNPAWLDPKVGQFLTSDGKTRIEGNHTRPFWCDLSGELEGGPGGITTFCHPSNFRFPQPVRLHPTMPYLSFSPVVAGPFTLDPGRPVVSQYRFFAHTGKPDVPTIDRLWNDYAHPVVVKVVSSPQRPIR